MTDISGRALGEKMLEAVKAYVARTAGALAERLGELEKRIGEIPAPRDGVDGKNGIDGVNGKDGISIKGDPGREGKDGRDGRDGTDGIGIDGRDALDLDILSAIDETRSYPRGTWAEYNGGVIRAIRNTDWLIAGAGLEKSGWSVSVRGIAEESEESLDEGRTIRRTTTYTNGRQFIRDIKTSVILYRGIWQQDEYQRGDVVTWGGSQFHCEATTKAKPETLEAGDDWRLCVKRGRDGKDGKDAAVPRTVSLR